MGLFSSSEFDELSLLVEKATSEYIPAAQEDLSLNLEITDIIKSKRVSPKDALRLLLSRLTHDNPNVQLLSLNLFDKCVKNGGKHFLVEMAGREFVDVAVSMMDDEEYGHECNQMVQDRLIELFQEWALLFQSDPSLAYFYDTYCNLKTSKRVIFPIPAKTLDHIDPLSIVSSMAPPEWSDSPSCQRCRDQFTMTNRKHHCRKCGGTFCQLCSSNEMVLLEMGINEPVRVCDTCYRQPTEEKRKAKVFEKKPQFEDSEDAELKKAIDLSLKDQQKQVTVNVERKEDEEALKKAIEASLKEAGPNHMTPIIAVQTTGGLNPVEVENISMFHQLIGRLVRTRPQLTSEDVQDLKKLAREMQRLQKKPIEEQGIKNQLEESLKGYELIFGVNTASEAAIYNSSETKTNPKQIQSSPSSLTEDLTTMKNEVLGDTAKGPEIGLVRTRLGSLSLENNQITDPAPVAVQQSVNYVNPVPAYHTNTPPSSVVSRIHEPMPLAPVARYQTSIPSQPSQHVISPPLLQHQQQPSYRHSLPPALHPMSMNARMLPLQSTPIQWCPDMTVHPHPIHPSYTHVNPYASAAISRDEKEEKEVKKKKKKKKKDKSSKKTKKDKSESEKKSEDEKKRRKKHKDKEAKEKESEKEKKKSRKDTSESSKKKKSKIEKEEKTKKSKSGEKRIKSIKMEIAVDPKDNELCINSIDEGRKSPINLIDL